MSQSKWFLKGINLIAILMLVCLPLQGVQGQDLPTITASGEVYDVNSEDPDFTVPFSLTFPPAGGPVRGGVDYEISQTNSDGSICTLYVDWNFTGTFEGGDGGAAGGGVEGTMKPSGCEVISQDFYYSGTWSGNFYGAGNGNGVYDVTITAAGDSASGQFGWRVTFSPEEFEAALQPAAVEITTDYIFATYGVYAVDSFPDDEYGQKAWTPHELQLLDEVLKNFPREMLDQIKLKRFVRNQNDLDNSGNPDPRTFGMYVACEKQFDPDCINPTGTIHVFDHASNPYDFADADTQFKATILHEMTHAMTKYKDEYSIYKNSTSSPLVQDFMNATRPNPAGGPLQNGWVLYGARGWVLYGEQGNMPPTTYGETSPSEDLCESVMMYMYDPTLLQASSSARYDFIRERIFGGVEYENGTPK
jgi:hypothetical protein